MYHCHSDYSLLDSCTKPEDYIKIAADVGQKCISISEHGMPRGWVSKKLCCDKVGIRYLHSVEIYLTENLCERVRDNYHTVLIAKNIDGVKELNRLVSKSCDPSHFYYNNRISFDEFLGLSDNILTTSACLASPLNKLPKDHPRYMELVNKYDFLEIQQHSHPDQIAFNKWLYELSQRTGKPLIVGTDTHSSTKYKAECRQALLEAKNKSYGDEDAFDLTYKTYDELMEMFEIQGAIPLDVCQAALDKTNDLYELTEDFELDKAIKYPILYGTREEDSKLFSILVENKFKEKLEKRVIPPEQEAGFRAAIDEEMRVFRKLKMDGFMLSMAELLSWCKSQGMAIGTARGSVGGSRVAYVTDIIDLNPETWHTVFSRFCNEDRKEIGDIDVDVVESDRPEIFNYISGRFGRDKTARVASYGTVKEKGVIDDVGRCLSKRWIVEHGDNNKDNPYSLKNIDRIKKQFDEDAEETKKSYPEIFYYFDGLLETRVSQSVHPAGMVISPITLDDNYGTFDKDGDVCLMVDMNEAHEIGLAKYDFLVLKTVQVIRDACKYIGTSYPKTNEIDWEDQNVWADMLKSSCGLFQFESKFAFDSLKKFKPHNLFDMSLINACLRPSGTSYRDRLLSHENNKNPSEIIDELLRDNLGYLVYQEDTIKFLQQVCGLSGSEADNIRRAIGRKDKDRLDAALPSILEGYCKKSEKPKEIAEQEANEFLRIIEDSASYQFGYNHSIAYCMLGYMCAYYRCYYPLEFLTSFLNNAANEDDIKNGTAYAHSIGIEVTTPKWGVSRGDYYYDKEKNIISKGISSIKYVGKKVAEELYELAKYGSYKRFVDVLHLLNERSSVDTRQIETLIKIDFFSEFGNQRELYKVAEIYYNLFKGGEAKRIKKSKVDGTSLEEIVKKYSSGVTKAGADAKEYTLLDIASILHEIEDAIKSAGIKDLPDKIKVQNYTDIMGYMGYITGKEEDRRKLYVTGVYPVKRRRDGKQFGYSVTTRSIGSGKDSIFTVLNDLFNFFPIKERDLIYCKSFVRDGQYYRLTGYDVL